MKGPRFQRALQKLMKKPETKYLTLLYCTYAYCSITLSYLIPQAASCHQNHQIPFA
jgi:hypothetical protein